MRYKVENKKLLYTFVVFSLINILLYLFINFFNKVIPFSRFDYIHNAHHYSQDIRIKNEKQFNFLDSLAQYDAQWYLKIAATGYPSHPTLIGNNEKVMKGLTYAFFPLYPLIIGFFKIFFHNIELTTFLITNILLIINFFSLYFVIKNIYGENLAYKTIFLLFLFPFSIFYRSYFTESLYLLLLIWFSYFLIKKKMVFSAIFLGLLNITKANGFLLDIYFLYELIFLFKKNKITIFELILSILYTMLPFTLWMIFCYFQTGDILYFYKVRGYYWFSANPFYALSHNILTILIFTKIPIHGFHYSKIDVLSVMAILLILIKSRKTLNRKFWWVSLLLYIFPLIVTDTMSFTRYQIVSFPLFIYISQIIRGKYYYVFLCLFALGLLTVSLFFVNWYWIG